MANTKSFFGRSVQLGGAFNGMTAQVTFGTSGENSMTLAGLAFEQVAINFNMPVQRLYDLGSTEENLSKAYLIAGRPEGQGQFTRLVGPTSVGTSFFQTFGDVCNAASNVMTINAGSSCQNRTDGSSTVNTAVQIDLHHVVLTSLNTQMSSNEFVMRAGTAFMFLDMDWTEDEAQTESNN